MIVIVALALIAFSVAALLLRRRRTSPRPTPAFAAAGPAGPPTASETGPPAPPAPPVEEPPPPLTKEPPPPPTRTPLADPVAPVLDHPAVRVLSSRRFDGCGDLPAAGPLADLALYLAVHAGKAVSSDTLRSGLATGEDAEYSDGTLYSYASRLRRHLPTAKLTSGRAGYRLHGVACDLIVFDHLAAAARRQSPLDAIASLSSALALVEGPPLDTDTTVCWIDDESFRTTVEGRIAAAALHLADVAIDAGHPGRARWGCHKAILAAPLDQTLAAGALTAAHATGQPGALETEWQRTAARLTATHLTPAPDLEAHYRRLRDQR